MSSPVLPAYRPKKAGSRHIFESWYSLTIQQRRGEHMAKRRKRLPMRGKQRRGKAPRGTKSAARKVKRIKVKRITAQKRSKRRVARVKPKAAVKKVGGGKQKTAVKKFAARKPKPQAEQQAGGGTETVIVDVVEEPIPGVMVVSEFEATRELDSDEE
jgi:hypothetical protein